MPINRRDTNGRIPRSSSIDSMVEAVWNETPRSSLTPATLPVPQPYQQQQQQPPATTPQYLQINYGNTGSNSRRESLLSPSAGRRNKQNRSIAGKFTNHMIIMIPHFAVCSFFLILLLLERFFPWLLLLLLWWGDGGECTRCGWALCLYVLIFPLLGCRHECRCALFKKENKTADNNKH